MRRLIDVPLSAGRPSPAVLPPPTEDAPWPLYGSAGWVGWYGEHDHPRAARGDLRVHARNFRQLLETIVKVEGGRGGGPDRGA